MYLFWVAKLQGGIHSQNERGLQSLIKWLREPALGQDGAGKQELHHVLRECQGPNT